MARIRSIKPEFWKSEAIARLPLRTRLTFIALWSYVDDNGVGRDVEKLVAADLYPLEDDPADALRWIREDLATLARESRIVRYHVEGKSYLAISNWSEHQRIDKPNKPRYPGPDDDGASLTCGYGESSESSRDTRESPAPGAVEQRSSGTEDLKTSPPPTTHFAEFWNVYPRKVAKQAAAKAYTQALRTTEPALILKGALAYRDDPNREDQYTAHPASWLNAGRWDDDPIPARQLRAVPSRASEQDETLRRWHDQAQAKQPEIGA